MESEVASSTKIALMLVILGTLIFVILVLIKIVNLSIFDKVEWVVNTADYERIRQYDEYDRKWVSGTSVLRALKLYEGTGFGIVCGTKDTILPDSPDSPDSPTLPAGNYALNFGGIFQGASGFPDETSPAVYVIEEFIDWKTKIKNEDTFYTKSFRLKPDGNMLKFENKAVTRHLKTDEGYIQPEGRFYAVLIHDITGEIVGLCFTQDCEEASEAWTNGRKVSG